ncbi:MAG: response regulator transcription factor [Clostridia bacterium]|nr:response regulator transcription factor [Clostridia bacterium]
MEKIRVVIADDMQETRKWFKSMFKDSPGIEIVGEAADGIEAYDIAGQLNPDIILMDIEMESKYSGLECTKRITQDFPNIKVVILTMHDDDEIFINSYVVGAKSFLLKNSSKEKIEHTINTVYNNKYMLDEFSTEKVLRKITEYETERKSLLYVMNMIATLTKTETEILKSLYEGKTYNEIIKERYIEKKTLENHITAILKKFKMKSTKQLIADLKKLRIFDDLF